MIPPSEADAERRLLARWPENRVRPSLVRMRALVDRLHHPERAVPVIHLTGTNGKTTTARLVDDLLRASGLRTGRYTSPHLHRVRERIAVDGAPLPVRSFTAGFDRIRDALEAVDHDHGTLSFFEAVTGLAFAAFADADIDVLVLEVGMGGAWDATNVADGEIAVFTPISLDHTELLGADVSSIAAEKAGIIKPGATVVLADQPAAAATVLRRRAHGIAADVVGAGLSGTVLDREPRPTGQLLTIRGRRGIHADVELPLLGAHQAGNAALAVAAVEAFLDRRSRSLPTPVVRSVLAGASSPGRLETLSSAPQIWADVSHNPAGVIATLAAIEEQRPLSEVVVVLAVPADKDVAAMLSCLAGVAHVVATQNSSSRCLSAPVLTSMAREELGRAVVSEEPDVATAIGAALRLVEGRGRGAPAVLVTGSVHTAADARHLLGHLGGLNG